MGWATDRVLRNAKAIPNVTSPQQTFEINDYSKGFDSFISNDKFPFENGQSNLWRLAQDARIITLGDYETRKGFDFHSESAGATQDQSITSTTGAADQSFNAVTQLAQKFTAGTSGALTRLDLNLKNNSSATGIIRVGLYTDNSGSPGTLVASSSISPSLLISSYAYYSFRFASAPTVISGTVYWLVVYVQAVGSGSYKWSSTTSATTAKTSADSGMTWSGASYALNFKQYYSTVGGSKGLFRATKSDGTKVTLLAQNTTLYSVDNVTGALTAIKTGLNAGATQYRFAIVNDIVYYVNSFDGYRKWDFTTESQVNATNYSNLLVHKGLMFLVRVDDPDRIDYSNFAAYETFTSTDFVDVPAPKTGDPIASVDSLNGYLLIRTNNSCFIFSGDDNSTFRLDASPDQKGTFGPNTSASDKNYTYFLSDDGMYKSNGTQPVLMSENAYNDILNLPNKSTAVVAVSSGRLYLWYTSPGQSFNDSCYVWNLNYSGGAGGADTIESFDTSAYVSQAVSSFRDNNELIVASSIVGQAYWQELSSNDYNNLGQDINFMLQTHYITAGSPAVLKEYRYWEPRFGSQSGSYTIDCQYAYDQRDNWQTYSSPNIQGSGAIWGSGIVWGSFIWGTSAENQWQLNVPGEYRRVAIRYRHIAARQPHKFLGHTFVIQTRRLR